MINPIKSFNCMEQWLKPCQSDNPLPLMWFIIIPYGILGTQISIQNSSWTKVIMTSKRTSSSWCHKVS
jgi:hypothetical protein